MIVETAYPFTKSSANDNLPNNINVNTISNNGLPISKEAQFQWYDDLSKTAATAGALGLVSWEPGWISATKLDESCTRIPFGSGNVEERRALKTGSSMENCSFFDFQGNVIANGGFKWLNKSNDSDYERTIPENEILLSIDDVKRNLIINSPKVSVNQHVLLIKYGKIIKSIQIYGLNGKQYLLQDSYNQSKKEHHILLPPVAKGLYIIKINTSKSNYIKKIII